VPSASVYQQEKKVTSKKLPQRVARVFAAPQQFPVGNKS
jgi:hypothetical protein